MIELDGSTNIPTQLYYEASGQPLIGHSARAAAMLQPHALTEDFKVELGNSDPSLPTRPRRRFRTAQSFTKTSAELTSDFLSALLSHTYDWLSNQGFETTSNVLLAEPLAMQTGLVEASWLLTIAETCRGFLPVAFRRSTSYLSPSPCFNIIATGFVIHVSQSVLPTTRSSSTSVEARSMFVSSRPHEKATSVKAAGSLARSPRRLSRWVDST